MSHPIEQQQQAIQALEQLEMEPRTRANMALLAAIADWRQRNSSGQVESARVDVLDERLPLPERQAALNTLIQIAEGVR